MAVYPYGSEIEAAPPGAQQARPAGDHRDEGLLTVEEVAQRLRVDSTTVRRWVKLGALEAIVLPHRGNRQSYRIRQSALDAILQSKTGGDGIGSSSFTTS